MLDWNQLLSLLAKRKRWVAAVCGPVVLVGLYFQPAINAFISGLRFERVPATNVLDPCRPSNYASLVAKGYLTCENLPARQKTAFVQMPKDVEVSFDALPNTFFPTPSVQAQLFIAHAGAIFSLKLIDEGGGALELLDEFKGTDPDDDVSIGTGHVNFRWCPHSGACETLTPSDEQPFPGYHTFSGPDYLAISILFHGSSATINYRMVQSYGDHPSPSAIDLLAGVGFKDERHALPIGRIVSMRFVSKSDDTRMRIEALSSSSESTTISLRGKVIVPTGINPEDALIHLEPMGSKGLGKDVATARVFSDGSFALVARAGEFEAWAEVRSATRQLYTGSCAVSLGSNGGNPWITFHPRTELPRAQRSPRKLCEQGTIALERSFDKDHFRH